MKNTKGFTLVEMMISVAIISIMTSVVFWVTGNNRTRAEVQVAAEELAARINEARQRSLTGDAGFGNIACGFGIHFSGNGYTTYYRKKAAGCENVLDRRYETEAKTPTTYIWNNLRVTADDDSATDTDIFFLVPFGDMTSTVPSTRIALGSRGYTRYVCVSASGVVSMGSDAGCSP